MTYFPQISPPKPCIHPSFSPTITCPIHLIILDSITQTIFGIWCWMQIMKLITLPSPPVHCHFIPVRPKYSAQHPILQHPRPMFLPQGKRLSFTTIWNKQNCSSTSFNLSIWKANGKTNDLSLNGSRHFLNSICS